MRRRREDNEPDNVRDDEDEDEDEAKGGPN
jgi:hypothetical protein